MSEAEFYWTLAKPPDAKKIDIAHPGIFSIHMERAFGALPCELSKQHLERLEGMASTWSDVSVSPYVMLIQAIKRYGTIRVYMQQAGDDS